MRRMSVVAHGLDVLLLVALGVPAWLGCSSTAPIVSSKPVDPTQERLLKVMIAYSQFNLEKKRPPKGPEDLKPLLAKEGVPDDLLRSARDNQPFVVCWGVDLQTPAAPGAGTPVLAYEKQGADGFRFVLTTWRNVEKMSAEEFRKASFPPGQKPSL